MHQVEQAWEHKTEEYIKQTKTNAEYTAASKYSNTTIHNHAKTVKFQEIDVWNASGGANMGE